MYSGTKGHFPTMLKKLYLTGLVTLLLAAGGGVAWCLSLAIQGDPRGIANIGKLLLLGLYSAYRLWAILSRRYLIYRPWETENARKAKQVLHGAMASCLCLLALAPVATAAGLVSTILPAVLILLTALLAVFLGLETINALGNTPAATHE